MIRDRHEAGQKLAEKLQKYKGASAIVLALPRGGVVVGYEIARNLLLPLDIIATRKIGHPSDPEYAIGAVDGSGTTVFNPTEIASVNEQWLKEETERQKTEAKRRTKLYRQNKKPFNISGKIVIIADDGIATGFTMQLAVKVAKKGKPEKIIVAAPVSPLESIDVIRKEGADEVILIEQPKEFLGSVGAHYEEFEQVEDTEVINLLNPSYSDITTQT